jgi:phosphoserine phosphatase RsbU/P
MSETRKPKPSEDVPVEKRLGDLEELLSVAKATSIEKDFDRLIDLIVSAANRVMEAERGSLYIHDEAAGELWTKIAHQTERFRIKVGTGIAGQAAAARQVINIRDADADPRHYKGIDHKSGFHTQTILAGPLINHDGRLIGVLQLLNKKTPPYHFTGYDESLLAAFSSHIAVTLDQARLVAQYVTKQKMDHDLALARNIQRSLLPKATPEAGRFDITGWSEACDETGGDYYDFVPMADGRLGLIVADVTGHGIGPALLMSEARAYARAAAGFGGTVDRMLHLVNNLLAADLGGGRFVTLFWGMLEPETGRLWYSSAGHEHSVLYRAATREIVELESTGLPLGVTADADFPCGGPFDMAPGDVLLVTTDGFEEAMNAARDQFGRERLRETLARCADGTAEEIARGIRAATLAFMAGAPQRDDLTLIVAKAKG